MTVAIGSDAPSRAPGWLEPRRSSRLRRHLDKAGLTATGAVVLILALAAWLLARALGGRGAFLFAYAGTALVVGCWALGRRRVAMRALRSTLPKRVRVGQLVEVDIEIHSRHSQSNIVLEESLGPQLGAPVLMPIAALTGGQTVRHRYVFRPSRRGVFQVGPLVATRIDPFALTKTTTVLADPVEVIVHPRVERVHDRVLTRQWEDPPTRPPLSKPWPTGYDFYGLREYADGDDPRRIIWRATARALDASTGTNLLLVRESEQGITDRVVLLLDTEATAYAGGDVDDTFEMALTTLASLALRHLRDGFALTIETSGRRIFDGLRGERHRVRLLDELARVQPEQAPLEHAVSRTVRERRRRSVHVVAITPHLTAAAAGGLRTLRNRGSSVLVAIVLPARFDSAVLQRAHDIGSNVVEVRPGVALERSFSRVVARELVRGR